MSLYADFLKETNVKQIIESEFGFMTYYINGKECYIADCYVVPDKRRSRLCWEMADMVTAIAKSKGCDLLTGSVVPQAVGSTNSLKMLLSYGMSLIKSDATVIYMGKGI